MSKLELLSPFTPEECEARLQAAVETGYFTMFSNKPVVGRVSGLTVRLRKRDFFRNSFRPYLFGRLEDRDGTTVFRGVFAIHPLVLLGLIPWFLFAGVNTVFTFATTIRELRAGGGNILGVLLSPMFLVIGIAIVWICRWMARGEEDYLASFVADVIGFEAQRADLP